MPNIADGDLYEVAFVFRHDQQNAFMIRHYVAEELVAGVVDISLIPAAISDLMGESFRAAMSSLSTYRGCTVKRLQPNPSDAFSTTADSGVGDFDNNVLPTQVAGLISWRTGFAGRSKRGRSYMPFPPDVASSPDGHVTNGHKTLLNNIAVNLSTDVVVSAGGASYNIAPIVYSRKLDQRFLITSHIIRGEWATQRKRSHSNPGDALPTP